MDLLAVEQKDHVRLSVWAVKQEVEAWWVVMMHREMAGSSLTYKMMASLL